VGWPQYSLVHEEGSDASVKALFSATGDRSVRRLARLQHPLILAPPLHAECVLPHARSKHARTRTFPPRRAAVKKGNIDKGKKGRPIPGPFAPCSKSNVSSLLIAANSAAACAVEQESERERGAEVTLMERSVGRAVLKAGLMRINLHAPSAASLGPSTATWLVLPQRARSPKGAAGRQQRAMEFQVQFS
jgi:hypothetical protein